MPAGEEPAAIAFYEGVLGLPNVDGPFGNRLELMEPKPTISPSDRDDPSDG